jgi:PAS domain S-box-containing protein
MVVEDYPEMRRFIADVLSSEFRVTAVADGLEALALVGTEAPDLVVTDLMMPRVGGDQFLKQMRARGELAQLPVLILSAKADDTLRLQLLRELAQAYIVKPFSAAELRVRVRNLVAMKRSRDQLQAELAIQSEDLALLTHQLILNKRTIEESLEAERKLSSLVENSRDFIGFASREDDVMFLNHAGRILVGLDEEEVRGTVPLDYVLEEDRPLVRAGMTAALENGNWEGEVRFRNFKTGVVIPMLQHIFVLTDTNSGRQIGLGTISRDITERKRAEEGLRMVQSELAHVSRVASMGELTASIAHEINQPLSAIVANANACMRMMNSQSPDLHDIRLAIDDIASSGKRASEVVSRIRALLRKSHSEKYQLDINEAIVDVLPVIRGELGKHRTMLHTRLQQGLPPVLGDRIELQQVLINLLLNGMEAMDEIQDRPRELVIESSRSAATVSVSVWDSGTGIGPSTMTKMYDTFFTTKSNGLGMGLPICRSIIESHGGRLSATPGTPHGTTFYFELPAAA